MVLKINKQDFHDSILEATRIRLKRYSAAATFLSWHSQVWPEGCKNYIPIVNYKKSMKSASDSTLEKKARTTGFFGYNVSQA